MIARFALGTMLVVSAPAVADDWVIGTEAVINVTVSTDADPITASLAPALRQSQALQAKNPKAAQWLVNMDWPAALTGVQFILEGSTKPFAGMTPDAWIGLFRFNGGSEKGVIEAGRWCRRTAARTYPEICKGVDVAVDSRNVWSQVNR